MIFLNPAKWEGKIELPPIKDKRWVVAALLLTYVIIGLSFLGFSRKPVQVICLVGFGALFDMVLCGILKGKWLFPLSAIISCLSLSIILNYSLGYQFLWVPVFITIASKYIFTLNGKHFFNPSLFGIVICLLFGKEFITLAPAYQWYGSVQSAWFMGFFVVTAAVLFFIVKINRIWLVLSFLFFFALQTALRAYIIRYIIPPETLFIGSLTSPAFYLFTFYMITDPATSPSGKREQILVGFFIAALDLFFHTRFSLYTFFFAGITVAGVRFLLKIIARIRAGELNLKKQSFTFMQSALVVFAFALPILFSFRLNDHSSLEILKKHPFSLQPIDSKHSGLGWAQSNILNEIDPRIQHVGKWILSVGDAVAVADIDLDGKQDIFLTQILKAKEWKAKLFLNKGDFRFEKFTIPELEKYLDFPDINGVPGFAFFLDYDNDGDKDLFVGFGFGKSHLFENRIVPDRNLSFKEVRNAYLDENNTICLAANAFDFNNDGLLDILIANTLPPYLKDYKTPTPLNIFKLPAEEYKGDRRMYHFMHESWHNANNGGENHLLLNTASQGFVKQNSKNIGLPETRWSLSIGTSDMNGDGFTDLYIANDFGHDDCYLNKQGKSFERQEGKFHGDVGLDTYKGMNSSLGDLDGNGQEDIYVSNVHHALQAEGSLLWLNKTGPGAKNVDLRERASQMNMLNTNRFGWGAAIVDINLDGWPDIIQANGMVADDWDKLYTKRSDYWYFQAQIARTGPNIHSYADKWADLRGRCIYENEPDGVFLNLEGQEFSDVSTQIGFNHHTNTRGIAAVDLDNDGDADLLVTDQFGATKLYENKIENHQWIGIELKGNGKSCSMDAVGSKVWLTYKINGNKKIEFREQHLVNGFSAQGDHRLLFGLGLETNVISDVSMKVKWQDGKEQVFTDLKLNTYTLISEP